jgi:Phage protein
MGGVRARFATYSMGAAGFGMIETRGISCPAQVSPSDDGGLSRTPSSTTEAAPFDPGAALAKIRTKFQDLCYGFPIDLIADWCCVDLKTARHYKSGTRIPGKAAAMLFTLFSRGLVVPAQWEGFSFRGFRLYDPYGKELTAGQLRAYQLGLQMMREWARGDALRTRTLDEIFSTATLALPPRPDRALPPPLVAGASPAEPKASDLVRLPPSETKRRRIAQRKKTARRSCSMPTVSSKVDGRSQPLTGNARRKADPFAALSPDLRAAANAGAK